MEVGMEDKEGTGCLDLEMRVVDRVLISLEQSSHGSRDLLIDDVNEALT